MKLPSELQRFISEEIGWTYNQLKGEARIASNISIEEYMGTYFPRSFTEGYKINQILFGNRIVLDEFLCLDKIDIIDIGSGTGGNILGFLWYLKDRFSLMEKKLPDFHIRAIDKNLDALLVQEKIANQFFGDNIVYDLIIENFDSKDDFSKKIKLILKSYGDQYHVVMSSKFINEFYTSGNEFNLKKGLYGSLVENAAPFISANGILILTDVTTLCFEGYNKWIPQIINEEIRYVLSRTNSCDISLIQPISCAFWLKKCKNADSCFPQKTFRVYHDCLPENFSNDNTKITFKIFSKTSFSEKILNKEFKSDAYVTSFKKNGKLNICKIKGDSVESISNETVTAGRFLPDAFGWTCSTPRHNTSIFP